METQATEITVTPEPVAEKPIPKRPEFYVPIAWDGKGEYWYAGGPDKTKELALSWLDDSDVKRVVVHVPGEDGTAAPGGAEKLTALVAAVNAVADSLSEVQMSYTAQRLRDALAAATGGGE